MPGCAGPRARAAPGQSAARRMDRPLWRRPGVGPVQHPRNSARPSPSRSTSSGARSRRSPTIPPPPTFDNTIVALEKAGQLLGQVQTVYGLYAEQSADARIRARCARNGTPSCPRRRTRSRSTPSSSQRIKAVYDARDSAGLDAQQLRLVERYYINYVNNGADARRSGQGPARRHQPAAGLRFRRLRQARRRRRRQVHRRHRGRAEGRARRRAERPPPTPRKKQGPARRPISRSSTRARPPIRC